MTTATIIKEIGKLPLTDKLIVIEKTLRSIRQEKENKLATAVDALYNDYKNDKELTIFLN
ncbi:MAG: hypothetical protein V4649_03565 [Bacteroidota bacterium]